MPVTNKMEGSTKGEVYLSNGLEEQDDRLDQLFGLFEQLQVATVEASHPDLDLLTFAELAYYFAVVLVKKPVVSSMVPTTNKASRHESPKKRPREAEGHSIHTPFDLIQPKIRKVDVHSSPLDSQLYRPHGTWSSKSSAWSSSSLVYDTPKADREGGDITLASASKVSSADDLLHAYDELDLSSPQHEESARQEEARQEVIPREEAVGLVYLMDPNVIQDDHLHVRELNIGIIIDSKHRGKGYARQAVTLVLKKAFQEGQCHRVQAIMPDHVAKHRAICLFTQMRFGHEGIRRRAFFSPLENTFKDVTYMGMLDTDWVLRNSMGIPASEAKRPAPQSVWDELFARHQREREDLLNWEETVPMYESVTLARARTPTQSNFRSVGQVTEEKDAIKREDGYAVPWTTEGDNGKWKPRAGLEVDSGSEGYESDAFNHTPSSESGAESVRSMSPSGYVSAVSRSPSLSPSPSSSSSSSSSAWDLMEPHDSEAESSGVSTTSFDDLDDMTMYEFARDR